MTPDEKIEHCKFVIGRYDFYYDSVNNKANFWLAFNTFAIGLVLTTYKDLTEKLIVPCISTWFNWGLVAFLAVAITASFIILKASWPHLNTRKRASLQSRSLIYFEDVAAVKFVDLQNALNNADDQQRQKDFATQVHQLATGLSRKYQRLAIAGRLMAVELGLLAYLIGLIGIGKIL
ncbi:Pycsar system effector family protein [uncultured Fibrella sp.]|uniref:Pycsar system effector family protein n=1 Tax=uncultured Fibrella sp. TaxID=1284596 RepID=UPI0035C9A289